MSLRYLAAGACLALVALLALNEAAAHGGSPVLYVDDDGEDSGMCDSSGRPCRSIGYALQNAGKGTQIRVAAGSYEIGSTEELFHIVSGVVDIRGGYDVHGGFAAPSRATSTLTGVPSEYRALLSGKGFHIISDRKGMDRGIVDEADKMLALHRQLKSGAAGAPCSDGLAGSLPCSNMDLLAHVAFNDLQARPAAANDVWGFVDLNSGHEYIIAGFNNGAAVIDVSDPSTPREIGFIQGQSSVWRDMKVLQTYDAANERYNAYAYVTTDGANDGLVIIDMTDLPISVRRVNYTSDFDTTHNVYISDTDFATGLPLGGHAPLLIIAGSNRNVGQFRAYSLDDPASPVLLDGQAIPDLFGADPTYIHDAASLSITDARKDTQCVNASDACDVLLDFNEQNIEVWDISNPADAVRLNPGRQEYAQRGYVHSGWWSEDRQFIFVQDELDEQRFGLNTTLRVFSIADLRNPVLAGTWTGPTTAIDHNGYVRGNRYYMSNYSRGLTVLDISDPANPVSSGRIDTYPFADGSGFVGAWGVYPFLPSGTIAVSDIDSGIYLVHDSSRAVAQGSFTFSALSYAANEGTDVPLQVHRNGGTAGSVSVDIEFVRATATSDDYASAAMTLAWNDGDSSDRTLPVSITDDGLAEGQELLLARLTNPKGGATLGDLNTTHLYLGDPGQAPSLRLLAGSIDVDEGDTAVAVIVMQRTGSAAGAVSIDYAVAGGNATPDADFRGPGSGTFDWADGDATPRTLAYEIPEDGATEGDEYFDIAFSNPAGATVAGDGLARVTISADPVSAPPPPVVSGSGNSSGGGGGAVGLPLILLGLMRLLFAARRTDPAT